MIHEKIIKQPGGKQFRITVMLITERYNTIPTYRYDVYHRLKGGKKWHNLPDTLHDFEFRKMSREEKDQHRIKNTLRFVPKEAIVIALMEAWEKLKPTIKIEIKNDTTS